MTPDNNDRPPWVAVIAETLNTHWLRWEGDSAYCGCGLKFDGWRPAFTHLAKVAAASVRLTT